MRRLATVASASGAVFLMQASVRAATANWTGAAEHGLWSNLTNWDNLPAGNDVIFGQAGVNPAQGVVDNIADQNLTINTLQYKSLSQSTNGITVGFHTTQINPGVTVM